MQGRAIVAGANGLLGRSLVGRLRQMPGLDVLALNRASGDLRDSGSWADLPHADVVFQLAARSFVPDSWQHPQRFVSDNLSITSNAAEYCRTHEAKLIYVSSYLYGNAPSLPIAETAPIQVVNPYALSKKLCEDLVSHFCSMFSFPGAIVRPFNIYGPGQDERFLLPLIVHQAQHADSIRLMDMEPKRDYIFVDDVADLLIAAAQSSAPFDIFNAGSGESHSVAAVVDIVKELIGRDVPVISVEERRVSEVMDTLADIAKARELLDWEPKVSLRAGLALLIDGKA